MIIAVLAKDKNTRINGKLKKYVYNKKTLFYKYIFFIFIVQGNTFYDKQ